MKKNSVGESKEKSGEIVKKIKQYFTSANIKKAMNKIKDKKEWYQVSYFEYIKFFEKHAFDNSFQANVIKIALVGSWVAHIQKPQLDQNKIKEFLYYAEKISNVNIASVVLDINESQKNDVNFKIKNEVISMKEYFKKTNALLNNSKNKYLGISTVSKFLHFQHPNLFPILDGNIVASLWGKRHISFSLYKEYFCSIRKLSQNTKQWNDLISKSSVANVSVLRFIDVLIYEIEKSG